MKKKVLLLDDDLAVRESLAAALAYENFQPLTAANGEEALRIASHIVPDIALLDLNLPGASGWDTFEVLSREHPTLPVIIITARLDQEFTARCAGVGALMEKPIDFIELLKTIRRLLNEPAETRLARLVGRSNEFTYRPSHQES